MKKNRILELCCLLFLLVSLSGLYVIGCGDSGSAVTGNIVNPSQPTAVPPQKGNISGTLVTAQGVPMADLIVILRAALGSPEIARTTTNSSGSFSFANITIGSYVIEALNAAGVLIANNNVSVSANSTTDATLQEGSLLPTPTPTNTPGPTSNVTVIPPVNPTSAPGSTSTPTPTGTLTPPTPTSTPTGIATVTPASARGPVAFGILASYGYVVNQTSGNVSLFNPQTKALTMSGGKPVVIQATATTTPGVGITGVGNLVDACAPSTEDIYIGDNVNPFLWVINSNTNAISQLIPLTDSRRTGHTTKVNAVSGTSNRVVVASQGTYDELIIVPIPYTQGTTQISYYPFDANTAWTALNPRTTDTTPIDVVDYSYGQSIYAALANDFSIAVLNQGTGTYTRRIPILSDPNDPNSLMVPIALDMVATTNTGVVVAANQNIASPVPKLLTFNSSSSSIVGRVNLVDENGYIFYPQDVMIDPLNGSKYAYVAGWFGDTGNTYGILIVDISAPSTPVIVAKTEVQNNHNPVDFSALGQYMQVKFGRYNTTPSQFYVANKLSNTFSILNLGNLNSFIDRHVKLNP